jgi:hypothetical protein
VYAIHEETGARELLQRYPSGRGANWVEMLALD